MITGSDGSASKSATTCKLHNAPFFQEQVTNDTWLPSLYLDNASHRRNPLVIPEDDSDIRMFDVTKLLDDHPMELGSLFNAKGAPEQANMIVFMDINTRRGQAELLEALKFAIAHENLDFALKHHCSSVEAPGMTEDTYNELLETVGQNTDEEFKVTVESIITNLWINHLNTTWPGRGVASPLAEDLGLKPGETAVLVNGRLVGPLGGMLLTKEDLETLADYEWKRRVGPTVAAATALKLMDKFSSPMLLARLSSHVALSAVSDVPEGIFDSSPGPRTDVFNDWLGSKTSFSTGNVDNSSIQIVIAVNPVSEVAQRWVSMLGIFFSCRRRLQ